MGTNPLTTWLKAQPYQAKTPGALQDPTTFLTRPRPASMRIDVNKPTGYEDSVAAYGNIALNFLQGFQQSRAQSAAQDYEKKVNDIRLMQGELKSVLENPDIDPNDKAQAELLFNENLKAMYSKETKGMGKKNPVIGLLDQALGPSTLGLKDLDPGMFTTELARMRQRMVPVSKQVQDSRERMLQRVSALREESPTLYLHDAMRDPDWQKEYAFLQRHGIDPVLDPSFEFQQLPKDAFEQRKALAFQARQREQIAKQRQEQAANRSQFRQDFQNLNTPAGVIDAGQRFTAPPPVPPGTVVATAPPPTAVQTAAPVMAASPNMGQVSATPTTTQGVPLSSAGRQAGVVYDQARPTINFSDPMVLESVKVKPHAFYLPDGNQIQVREVIDAVDPGATPYGYYDESGRPISTRGLLTQRPDLKNNLTPIQVTNRVNSFKRQADDYVGGKVIDSVRAMRDYEAVAKAYQAGDLEGAERLEKAALDSYSREAQRIQKMQDEAREDARRLADRKEFNKGSLTNNALSAWERSPYSKTVSMVGNQLRAINEVLGFIKAAESTNDSGLIDQLLVSTQAKIADPLTGVRDAETRNYFQSVGTPITPYVNAIQSLVSGDPKRLSKEERERLVGTVRASALGLARGAIREAQHFAKSRNNTGAAIEWRDLMGIGSVLEMFPGLDRTVVNPTNPQPSPQPPQPPTPDPAKATAPPPGANAMGGAIRAPGASPFGSKGEMAAPTQRRQPPKAW